MSTAVLEQPKTAAPPKPGARPIDADSASINIPLSKIVRSPFNRAVEVNEDFIADIRRRGVIQHIMVRPIKATIEHVTAVQPHAPFALGESIYELVCGERRWLGSKKAGRAFIGATVRILTDAEVLELQIAENEHRENYSPMDRAEAYHRLFVQHMEAHKGERGWTETKCAEQIAGRFSREVRTVQQVMTLNKLAWQVQQALRNGEMEASHGYEIARRTEDEQLELLSWLRKETQHSHGDVPSVRRLKDVIRKIDIAADEKRRQDLLFKPPQPGTAVTKVPTVAEAEADTCEWRCGMCNNLNEARNKKFCKKCGAERGMGNSYQSPARAVTAPKPPTPAQLKKQAAAEAREREQDERAQRARLRKARIEKKFQGLFLTELAKKAVINSRFLTHILPDLIYEVWDNVLPIEDFAQSVLGWPAPKGEEYLPNEVRHYSEKHTRKYSPGLLAALEIALHYAQPKAEKLGKYFGVDPKKLRAKAAAAVKEEEKKAKKKGGA